VLLHLGHGLALVALTSRCRCWLQSFLWLENLLYLGDFGELYDVRPVFGVLVEHRANNTPKIFRIRLGNAFKFAVFDFHGQVKVVGGLERRMKSSHFVNTASKRPNITLIVVVLLIDLLRAHVVRRAHVSCSKN
jgi:hypothetical protein